ncbi:metallophosphoesterase family protein [Metabacillus sp. B2-18]|uniref:metallophosphoesterase family protein n=1 Tax=Metabacillus sp. B2-18 TaxID=2897333 RepID=UPI001E5DA16E|nr:metallophosphoesterase family protein [Metabacillus sp. B2-18]UGB28732.1 metallophosphatase family protein [Metabacillus sp. B2-18]
MEQKIAVISDIHGNSLALKAVLQDITRRGIDNIINLGDSLFGPLDPLGTFTQLIEHKMLHIMGNCDRMLLEPVNDSSHSTLHEMNQILNEEHLDWIKQLPSTVVIDDILLCHGTPDSDEVYLLEEMTEAGGILRSSSDIMKSLHNVEQSVILCGHSHIPRTVYLPNGKLVVNPGSVGLPAYNDDFPIPHKMESGSPYANYTIMQKEANHWFIEQINVPYDWERAAEMANQNNRKDWAKFLLSGRA